MRQYTKQAPQQRIILPKTSKELVWRNPDTDGRVTWQQSHWLWSKMSAFFLGLKETMCACHLAQCLPRTVCSAVLTMTTLSSDRVQPRKVRPREGIGLTPEQLTPEPSTMWEGLVPLGLGGALLSISGVYTCTVGSMTPLHWAATCPESRMHEGVGSGAVLPWPLPCDLICKRATPVPTW